LDATTLKATWQLTCDARLLTLLKPDQSLVRNMPDDADDLTILKDAIRLSAAFKREVFAEGVETVAHGIALLHSGCELAQGYGVARHMPAEQISDSLMRLNVWCRISAYKLAESSTTRMVVAMRPPTVLLAKDSDVFSQL
jgi:predicted signal transduction protein with EAL and GGDEF domain